jgi:hypothetical protein
LDEWVLSETLLGTTRPGLPDFPWCKNGKNGKNGKNINTKMATEITKWRQKYQNKHQIAMK